MTVAGSQKLKQELENLKNTERPKIINAIAEAREMGDLKENAEYHSAREQQSFIEGRIEDIENMLSNAQVIDVSQIPNNGKVIFGSTVTLKNKSNNDELSLVKIVGEAEADSNHNLISVASPLARSLVSAFVGDVISVSTPGGDQDYEILKVEYL